MAEQTFTASDVCSLLEDLRAELLHRNAIVRNLRVTCRKPNPEAGFGEKLLLAVEQRKHYNALYGRLYQGLRSYECARIDIEQLEVIYEQTRISVSRRE